MRKTAISLLAITALAATSVAFAEGTLTREHGIGGDCAKITGYAVVDGPIGGPATGPGVLRINGLQLEGTFTVLGFPDFAAVRVDPLTGVIEVAAQAYERYEFGGNVMYAIDVAHYMGHVDTPGVFDIYGASVSGPAFMQSPDYPSWGSGAFAKALLSIRFRGTFQLSADSTHGEFTIEDGSICNVDWKAIKKLQKQ
jgi:hypothetical protein